MNKNNIVILLLLILFVFYICQNKEHFVYMNKIYNKGGTCNDYIPNYKSCNITHSFDSNENFTCPCSKRYRYY